MVLHLEKILMDCRVFIEFGVERGDELVVLLRGDDFFADNGEHSSLHRQMPPAYPSPG